MKIPALLLFTVVSLAAQDAVLETTPPQTTVEANRAAQRKLEAQQKKAEEIMKKKPPFTYGGVVSDWRKAEDKSKFFSLRRPVEPKKDYRNIWYDVRSGKPRGFVLFALDF